MLSAFNEHFSTIPDARQQSKVEHKLHGILLTLVVSVICGADGWEAIEEVAHHKVILLKKYGSFENGIPVHDTIARVISAIAPDKLQQCFISWMKAAHIATKGGKLLRLMVKQFVDLMIKNQRKMPFIW